MTTNDKIFITFIISATLLVGVIITHNVTTERQSEPGQTAEVPPSPDALSSDPSQTQAIKEKFEKMGLSLHEGKYGIRP